MTKKEIWEKYKIKNEYNMLYTCEICDNGTKYAIPIPEPKDIESYCYICKNCFVGEHND